MRSLIARSTHRLSLVTAALALVLAPLGVTAYRTGMFFTLNSQWSTTARNARLTAINTQAASGFLDFQSGAQPANADAAVTGTQLCSIALGATPFHPPASAAMANNGVISCTGTAGAGGAGTAAGYVVLFKSDHTTVLWEGSVATTGANINLPSTTITTGETVQFADAALTISDFGSISGY